jgi:hypothetical protein
MDIPADTKIKIRLTEVLRALVPGVRASWLDLTKYGAEAISKRLNG